MATFIQAAAFVKWHIPTMRDWPRANLLSWLRWMDDKALVAVVMDGVKFRALGIARPLVAAEHGADFYAVEPGGEVMFVDLVVSRHAEGVRILWGMMVRKFGRRKWIAFQRGTDRIRVYRFDRVEELLFRSVRGKENECLPQK